MASRHLRDDLYRCIVQRSLCDICAETAPQYIFTRTVPQLRPRSSSPPRIRGSRSTTNSYFSKTQSRTRTQIVWDSGRRIARRRTRKNQRCVYARARYNHCVVNVIATRKQTKNLDVVSSTCSTVREIIRARRHRIWRGTLCKKIENKEPRRSRCKQTRRLRIISRAK